MRDGQGGVETVGGEAREEPGEQRAAPAARRRLDVCDLEAAETQEGAVPGPLGVGGMGRNRCAAALPDLAQEIDPLPLFLAGQTRGAELHEMAVRCAELCVGQDEDAVDDHRTCVLGVVIGDDEKVEPGRSSLRGDRLQTQLAVVAGGGVEVVSADERTAAGLQLRQAPSPHSIGRVGNGSREHQDEEQTA